MIDFGEFLRDFVHLVANESTRMPTLTVLGGGIAAGVIGGRIFRKSNNALLTQIANLQKENHQLKTASSDQESRLSDLTQLKEDMESQLHRFTGLHSALMSDDGELWRIKPPKPPANFEKRLAESKTKIVTVAHLKGGVGKTTLVTNLAAYFDLHLGLKVLIVDLDFQGTQTDMYLGLAGSPGEPMDHPGSEVDGFITGEKTAKDIASSKVQVPWLLPNTHLMPADYELSRSENVALMRWLMDEDGSDLRYRLADVMLSPEVQNNYDVVLFDTPPRLGPALVNALCASHYYFIPTIMDKASSRAVPKFVRYVDALISPLNKCLKLGGVVTNFASGAIPTDTEKDAASELAYIMTEIGHTDALLKTPIRHTKRIHNAAGEKLIYSRDRLFRENVVNQLGAEIVARMNMDKHDEDRSVA